MSGRAAGTAPLARWSRPSKRREGRREAPGRAGGRAWTATAGVRPTVAARAGVGDGKGAEPARGREWVARAAWASPVAGAGADRWSSGWRSNRRDDRATGADGAAGVCSYGGGDRMT